MTEIQAACFSCGAACVACLCGLFQCLFCATESGGCPGCARRGPVDEVSRDSLALRGRGIPASELPTVRVLQRNLVYVIGLSPLIADEELLKTLPFFGQFGPIKKCVVNKNNAYKHAPGGVSYSVYVTFNTEEACAKCIKAVDGFVYDSREMKASYGTTKYCSYFLKEARCPKPDCLYLHKLGSDEETFTREDIQHQKHLRPKSSLLVLAQFDVMPPSGLYKFPSARIVRTRRAEPPPKVTIPEAKFEPARPRLGSRYDFVQEETTEQPTEIPEYIKDFVQTCSPNQRIAAVSAKHIDAVLSPTSPDKWMSDVITARKRAMSEAAQLMWHPRKLFYTESPQGLSDDVVIITSKS